MIKQGRIGPDRQLDYEAGRTSIPEADDGVVVSYWFEISPKARRAERTGRTGSPEQRKRASLQVGGATNWVARVAGAGHAGLGACLSLSDGRVAAGVKAEKSQTQILQGFAIRFRATFG